MKYLLTVLAFAAAIAPAYAQQPAPPAAPPTVIPSEYHLTVTPQEVDLIGAAIMELPAKAANPLATKLQGQISSQIQAATKDAADKKAATEPKK